MPGNPKQTQEDFIRKAIAVHGTKFDYSKVRYLRFNIPITIICPKHGPFQRKPYTHISGQSCNKCSYEEMRLPLSDFLRRAKKVHGGKYDYSKVVYEHINKKVSIGCKTHGLFYQTPSAHLSGCGCKKCSFSSQTGFAREDYTLGDRVVRVQGYEPQALTYLVSVSKIDPNKIKVGKDVPVIRYYDVIQNKYRLHFPDIFIPDKNSIIEVKSPWTFLKDFSRMKRKRKGAVSQGYNYTVLVMTSKGRRVPLSSIWYLLPEEKIKEKFSSLVSSGLLLRSEM